MTATDSGVPEKDSLRAGVARRWARWRLPRETDPLFVYGTLRFPEVLIELIGRAPEFESAELSGRRVAALPERVYPGLVAANGVANGFLLSGLTAREWQVLDAFEDEEYELRPVSVHAGDRHVYAWTYMWTGPVVAQDWSPQRFAVEELTRYLGKCTAWRKDLVLVSGTV
ncbi:gamma-glutamylcyclotransferase family protein [Nocardia sp. NPDC051030]|uniref:gamma-glutamylcyclotransferase family protein n=1 Tax=Nocardia sp. NPDC051030 TaxID=3155162 RepID=UPI00343D02B0